MAILFPLLILKQSFEIIFIAIQNAVFPTDLLLSYWGLMYCKFIIDFSQKIPKLEDTSIPFCPAHNDCGLNECDLFHKSC